MLYKVRAFRKYKKLRILQRFFFSRSLKDWKSKILITQQILTCENYQKTLLEFGLKNTININSYAIESDTLKGNKFIL